MNNTVKLISILFTVLIFCFQAEAQPQLTQDYSRLMEVPEVAAMQASPTHLYVLSQRDGMAVFRTYSDSLQWLYTSSGMQRRGHKMMSDIRFAYLFGNSRRLTVLEPTSVLGVYSSTVLPAPPKGAARLNNDLFIAMGDKGLGVVSLETPETVDTAPQFVMKDEIDGASVIDIRSSNSSNQLFVLTNAPALLVFSQEDDQLQTSANISLKKPLNRIFIENQDLWGSTESGEIYEIQSRGIGKRIGRVNEPVDKIISWNEFIFARTESGKVWTIDKKGKEQLWKNDTQAGNFLAKSGSALWISENNMISEVLARDAAQTATASGSTQFAIKNIPNQVVPYPKPLLLPLEMQGDYPADQVEFSYRSNVTNAKIRKQGFFWQPTVNQVGTFWFNIVASSPDGKTDSTRFVVDVRAFNTPPRFSPIRSTSIAVNEKYELQISATDPENPQSSLIRYIGVDLPDGSTINEKTGLFTWTPSERQIGESTFKVIATDLLGAASSIDVTLKVLNISRDGESE